MHLNSFGFFALHFVIITFRILFIPDFRACFKLEWLITIYLFVHFINIHQRHSAVLSPYHFRCTLKFNLYFSMQFISSSVCFFRAHSLDGISVMMFKGFDSHILFIFEQNMRSETIIHSLNFWRSWNWANCSLWACEACRMASLLFGLMYSFAVKRACDFVCVCASDSLFHSYNFIIFYWDFTSIGYSAGHFIASFIRIVHIAH